MAVQACIDVVPKNTANFNVDNVRVVKILGGGAHDSKVVKGVVIKRSTEGAINDVTDAKVAVFAQGVDTASTETKVLAIPAPCRSLIWKSSDCNLVRHDAMHTRLTMLGGFILEVHLPVHHSRVATTFSVRLPPEAAGDVPIRGCRLSSSYVALPTPLQHTGSLLHKCADFCCTSMVLAGHHGDEGRRGTRRLQAQ